MAVERVRMVEQDWEETIDENWRRMDGVKNEKRGDLAGVSVE